MTSRKLFRYPLFSALVLMVSGATCAALHGQTLVANGALPDAPVPAVETPAIEAASPVVSMPRVVGAEHRFWDQKNRVLFVAAAAMNGADFAVTRANLQNGGQELNPVVRVFGRSSAGLAVNFIGETAGVIGLSYFFHKTGHHKLERAVSVVNIGSSAGAVAYGLAHR